MSEQDRLSLPWYTDKKEAWKVRCDNTSVVAEFNSAEDAEYCVNAVNELAALRAAVAEARTAFGGIAAIPMYLSDKPGLDEAVEISLAWLAAHPSDGDEAGR